MPWKNFIYEDEIMKINKTIQFGKTTKYAVLALGIFAAIALIPKYANATLGNPLDSLPDQSNPVQSFYNIGNYGNLTGADGDVSSTTWVACSDKGGIISYNGSNNSAPIGIIDIGIPGLTGIACLGNDRYAVSAGKNIYEGTLSGCDWTTTNIISPLGIWSDLTDVDFALGSYFIATQSNGILRVNSDESTTQLNIPGVGAWKSLDIIEFKADTYDNPIMQFATGANFFNNINVGGFPIGSSKDVFLDNTFDIQGIAYFDGGFAVVQSLQFDIHNPMDIQQYMQPIPEPYTIALLGFGILNLLRHKKL
jgi:hypothetical protein